MIIKNCFIFMRFSLCLALFCFVLFAGTGASIAQEEREKITLEEAIQKEEQTSKRITPNSQKQGFTDTKDLKDMLSEPVPEYEEGIPQSQRQFIYEVPTVASISHLYWALGMMDYEDEVHIDNFLRINECEITQRYLGNEYEWKKIRKATVNFIKKNVKDFPTRFELVIPVRLEEYDVKRRAFRIMDEDQVIGARRFEMYAKDYTRMICWIKTKEIEGYPKALIIELSRPFSITYVPAPQEAALKFIKEKDDIFQSLTAKGKSRAKLYDLRTVYVIMQLKIFAHRDVTKGANSMKFLQVMAALEGFEIYGNPGHKDLFYSKNYLQNKDEQKLVERIKKEHELLLQKAKGEGIFH